MNTEPNSCSDWNNKEILIEDAKNCKGKLKMLGKKMKVSSIKKADEKKFFRD